MIGGSANRVELSGNFQLYFGEVKNLYFLSRYHEPEPFLSLFQILWPSKIFEVLFSNAADPNGWRGLPHASPIQIFWVQPHPSPSRKVISRLKTRLTAETKYEKNLLRRWSWLEYFSAQPISGFSGNKNFGYGRLWITDFGLWVGASVSSSAPIWRKKANILSARTHGFGRSSNFSTTAAATDELGVPFEEIPHFSFLRGGGKIWLHEIPISCLDDQPHFCSPLSFISRLCSSRWSP